MPGTVSPGGQLVLAFSVRQVSTMRFFGTPSARAFSPSSSNFALARAAFSVGKGPATARFVVRSKTRHSLPPPSWIVDWTGASRSNRLSSATGMEFDPIDGATRSSWRS